MIKLRMLCVALALTTACIWFVTTTESQTSTTYSGVSRDRVHELHAANNANGAAVVSLAVERFNYDRKLGQTCIMTIVEDIELKKYGDGQFTVIALPSDLGTNYSGIERFVHSYNHMVIRDADSKMKNGQLDFAEKAYRLILKHDPSNNYTNELRARLRIVSELRSNANSASILWTKLKTLQPDYDMFSFNEGMGTKPSVIVSNLLEFEIKDLLAPASSTSTNLAVPSDP